MEEEKNRFDPLNVMAERQASLESEVTKQKERVQKIEIYFKVAALTAVIFGIGAGFGGCLLQNVKSELDTIQEEVKEAKQQISDSTQVGIRRLRQEESVSIANMEKSLKDLLQNGGVITECRVCFKAGGPNDQCGGDRNTCSGWSSEPQWTDVFNDDTDDKPGGCSYQWNIECR